MKKIVILFAAILLAISSVFAADSFRFNAYYIRNSNNEYMELQILEDGVHSTLNAGVVVLTEQGNSEDAVVFRWEVLGNVCTPVAVKFSFTPLQAQLDNTFYIPQHTFKIKLDSNLVASNGNAYTLPAGYQDTFYINNTGANFIIDFDTDAQIGNTIKGNYPYPAPYNNPANGYVDKNFYQAVTISGQIQKWDANTSSYKDMTKNDSRVPWLRKGYCELNIRDYSKEDGDFTYVSNVKVEVTKQ